MADSVRVIVEVQAGIVPGQAEDEFTRRWHISSEDWHNLGPKQGERLAEVSGKAQGYAMLLMLQPDRFNWVRTDWLWT